MSHRSIALGAYLLLLAGSCAADPQWSRDRPLGGIGKADSTGSCEGTACDGPAPQGDCYCDDDCDQFGDCCADKHAMCDESECGYGDHALCPAGYRCELADLADEVLARLVPFAHLDFPVTTECAKSSLGSPAMCCDAWGETDARCTGWTGSFQWSPDGATPSHIETAPHRLILDVPAQAYLDNLPVTVRAPLWNLDCLLFVRVNEASTVRLSGALHRDPSMPELTLELESGGFAPDVELSVEFSGGDAACLLGWNLLRPPVTHYVNDALRRAQVAPLPLPEEKIPACIPAPAP